MSQHVVVNEVGKWVFGWDQPLMGFYLQLHDPDLSEEDNPVIWFGAGSGSETLYEVEDLDQIARRNGLDIDYDTRIELYEEKANG